jgi:hypothetical protein
MSGTTKYHTKLEIEMTESCRQISRDNKLCFGGTRTNEGVETLAELQAIAARGAARNFD